MKPCFINSVGCVSTQNTIDNNQFLNDIVTYNSNVISIVKPNYRAYMQGASSRRMAKGVKMGVVASTIALKEAGITNPDAIITGTGMGCVVDSEKFLGAIIDNDEQFLTPTSFIQSTHNTVGGQIALGLKCKSYNFTYVHGSVSFETCLIDAQLMLSEDSNTILVGGVDELGAHTTSMHKLIHHIKEEEEIATKSILNSNTNGAVFGEGASFFVLSNKQQNSSYAKLIDVATFNTLPLDSVSEKLHTFLDNNNITINDIDAVILGNNGDTEFDTIYNSLQKNVLKNTTQVVYKHLSGEYNTASSFGFWVGCKILKNQIVPKELLLNEGSKKGYSTILLYNQYRDKDHSFILLQKC